MLNPRKDFFTAGREGGGEEEGERERDTQRGRTERERATQRDRTEREVGHRESNTER